MSVAGARCNVTGLNIPKKNKAKYRYSKSLSSPRVYLLKIDLLRSQLKPVRLTLRVCTSSRYPAMMQTPVLKALKGRWKRCYWPWKRKDCWTNTSSNLSVAQMPKNRSRKWNKKLAKFPMIILKRWAWCRRTTNPRKAILSTPRAYNLKRNWGEEVECKIKIKVKKSIVRRSSKRKRNGAQP